GRRGALIDQVQVVCETFINEPFLITHTPHTSGPSVGGRGGRRVDLECAGKRFFQELVGRSGDFVDRLSAICMSTSGPFPLKLDPTQIHTPPFAGGHGGSEFSNECSVSSDELMVGLLVRSGTFIDAIQPLCANAQTWAIGATGEHGTGVWSGGGGGRERRLV